MERAAAGTIEGRSDRPGLRERKAAATRLAIAEALSARLQTTQLAEISVEQLADDANVSRMTFFNYFPSKEHAIDLVMVIFLFRIEEAIVGRGLRGVAAIECVFEVTGGAVAEAPERMRRVIGYFASRPADRPLPELSRAERHALASTPAALALSPGSQGGLLMRLLEESKEARELDLKGSSYELAHFLGSVLNGACLIGHSSPETDWKRLFRRHARRALGLLGAKGMIDPAPPRVPARWRKGSKR